MSKLWKFSNAYDFRKGKFADIYRFYVIECSVEGVSRRGRSFKERGILLQHLNRELRQQSPFLNTEWYVLPQSEIEAFCERNGIQEGGSLKKEIIIQTNSKKSKTENLFYCIRNAFAHGAFEMHKHNNKMYYALENRYKGKLKSRMLIQEQTLLDWMQLVRKATTK